MTNYIAKHFLPNFPPNITWDIWGQTGPCTNFYMVDCLERKEFHVFCEQEQLSSADKNELYFFFVV